MSVIFEKVSQRRNADAQYERFGKTLDWRKTEVSRPSAGLAYLLVLAKTTNTESANVHNNSVTKADFKFNVHIHVIK